MTTKKAVTLAIIVPAYNEELILDRCLRAIANQTYPPDEVIIVNNNSTDRTVEIAKKYPFVTVIDEPEQGMVPARDAGLSKATSDLLGRIDADSEIAEDWVAVAHALLDAHTNEICGVSGPAYIYEIKLSILRKLLGAAHTAAFYNISKLLLKGKAVLYGSNMVMTKKAWNKVKGEVCHLDDTKQKQQALMEDIDLSVHIWKYGNIFYSSRLRAGISKRAISNVPIRWRLTGWVKTANRHNKT